MKTPDRRFCGMETDPDYKFIIRANYTQYEVYLCSEEEASCPLTRGTGHGDCWGGQINISKTTAAPDAAKEIKYEVDNISDVKGFNDINYQKS